MTTHCGRRGGDVLGPQELIDTEETAGDIKGNGPGGSPPEKRVAHKVHIVIGLLAGVVVHAAAHEGPGPGVRLVRGTMTASVLIISVDRRAEIVMGPPHDAIQLPELLEERQWPV